jgi:RNA polymerase sigma-32 factor
MTEHDADLPDEIEEPQDVEVLEEEPSLSKSKEDALATAPSTLSRRDPLAVYMRDVQRYPLLSKEEEHDLAIRYFEADDLEAAKRLVTSNLRLVVKIAYDYRQAYKNILDLVQEGNIGLMQAVKKYDPYKGVKLSSYAAWWIRAYILRYILNNHRLVKVGTTQAQRKLFFNLQKEKARLSAMGIEPTAEIIAERLNVPERDVVSMDMRLAAGDASLDAPVGTSEGRSVARVELLPSGDVRVDDTLADAEVGDRFAVKIHEFGKTLEGKEKKIFDDRLVSEDPKTLQVLGDEFGVSRERVRQIEKRLLKKLKAFLREELGETVVEVYESP